MVFGTYLNYDKVVFWYVGQFKKYYIPTYVPKKVACKIILGDAKKNIMS